MGPPHKLLSFREAAAFWDKQAGQQLAGGENPLGWGVQGGGGEGPGVRQALAPPSPLGKLRPERRRKRYVKYREKMGQSQGCGQPGWRGD